MKRLHLLALGTLSILFLSACGGAASEGISNPEPRVDTPEQSTTPPPSTPEISLMEGTPVNVTSPVPRELAEKAKGDLAGHLNISPDQIRVADSRTVDWPDTSLGCPQPDRMYAQAVTPGYWILLEVNGRPYPYHTDMGEQVILCLDSAPDPEADVQVLPILPVNPTEIQDGQPWVPID